jgi:folate-binding protein YgfZ
VLLASMSDVARTVPDAGGMSQRTIVLDRGDLGREYAAIRGGALIVDRSYRSRIRFGGPRAKEMLTGLVTNDIASLASGHGLYAAALTPKGKIVADVRVFAGPESLLTDTGPRAAAGWADIVRKYVNPRVAPYQDESATTTDIGVFGPRSAHAVGAAAGLAPEVLLALPMYGQTEATSGGAVVTIARVPDMGVEGFDLWTSAPGRDALWAGIVAAGAIPGGLSACEISRVEAGRPEWGIDIDDTTIPQEANFDELGAISYTKGCYTGQETVARIHFRGHVNRLLRRLRLSGGTLPPRGALLTDADGKSVGDTRSAVLSPRLGPIALGMVRREVAPGATLIARWDAGEDRDAGETTVTVIALAFGSPASDA